MDAMNFTGGLVLLCEKVETLAPGSIAGLTICDRDRTHFARAIFPRLPPTFAAAIPGIPITSPFAGTCVQAVCLGQVVTSADVANDSRFDPNWKKLCIEHGVLALQSRPIYVHGKPSGSFVLAFREIRKESDWDVALMRFAADAAGMALAKDFTPE